MGPPVQISSRKVKAMPLIKRACCSSFIPVNAGTVFRRLKRKLGSAPLMRPKWFLLVKGFNKYVTTKRRNHRIRNLKKAVRNIKVLKLKCGANHVRPAFKEIKREAHMKPTSEVHTYEIF